MKVRRNELESDLKHIRRKSDGYYMPIYAQGGGSRIFWSFAGKTLKAARETVANCHRPTKPAGSLPPSQERRFLSLAQEFRAAETAVFNKTQKIGFYTDYPWRFSADNRDNPTTQLFESSGLRYEFIQSEQILAGELRHFSAVFCPGGFGYFVNAEMGRRFKEYVRAGGGLFGFCAGAFFPLKDFLGMCDSTFTYFREQGFADVLLDPRDPLAHGIESAFPSCCYALYPRPAFLKKYTTRIKIKRCNGPLLVRQGRDIAPAYFDSTEKYAPIIRANHGKGRVVLVSPHPDTGMAEILKSTNELNLMANLKLFKNIVLYCAGLAGQTIISPRIQGGHE